MQFTVCLIVFHTDIHTQNAVSIYENVTIYVIVLSYCPDSGYNELLRVRPSSNDEGLTMRVPSCLFLLATRLLPRPSLSGGIVIIRCASSMADDQEGTNYFLLKSEPQEFSIQDLQRNKGCIEEWTGVRNYEARNILRSMKVGDRAFFYHSSCKATGVVGTMTISRVAQPDVTAYQNPEHDGYDPKSSEDNCRWDAVQVRLEAVYPVTVLLKELKEQAKCNTVIAGMTLLRKSRLSVSRVTPEEWVAVERLVERKASGHDLL